MQITVPVPAQMQASTPASRDATAVLRGAEIPVDCPVWCRTDHATDDLMFIEDLSHEGPAFALSVPRHSGPDEQVLRVRMAQWPFTRQPSAYLAIEAGDDGECAELRASAALAFADQITAHAETIRRMATELQKEVA